MDTIFKKLNYKVQKEIVVFQAPKSFEVHLQAMKDLAKIYKNTRPEVEFFIGFATKQDKLNEMIHLVAPNLKGDAVFWICYPKMSSKKYSCEFNRDKGWAELGHYDMEPVRAVAIDEDWSALRFRKIDYIKTFTRKAVHALSDKGKERMGE